MTETTMAAKHSPPPDPRGADVQRAEPQFTGTAKTSTGDLRGGPTAVRNTPSAPATSARHLSGFSAGLGAWLIVAPFLLGYELVAPMANDVVCGVLVLALAVTRYSKPLANVWASWTVAGIGAWLIFAPYVLAPYEFGAYWNDLVVGALLVLTGASSALATGRGLRAEPGPRKHN
jgi:VIT1/CCC1 family predicted Fe2+/Mn2+ transporter